MSESHVSAAIAALQAVRGLAGAVDFETAIKKVFSTMSLKDEIDSIIQSSAKDKSREILLAVAYSATNCLDYLQDDTTMVEDIENWLFAEALDSKSVEA